MMHEQIISLFKSPRDMMMIGLWMDGIEDEGEYKGWFFNWQLRQHSFHKDGKPHGKYREWYNNGQQRIICYFKNGEYDGEYKSWEYTGELSRHDIYKDGDIIRSII